MWGPHATHLGMGLGDLKICGSHPMWKKKKSSPSYHPNPHIWGLYVQSIKKSAHLVGPMKIGVLDGPLRWKIRRVPLGASDNFPIYNIWGALKSARAVLFGKERPSQWGLLFCMTTIECGWMENFGQYLLMWSSTSFDHPSPLNQWP